MSSYYVESLFLRAYDALDVARVERLRADLCERAARRYQARGMDMSESMDLRAAIYHRQRADLALLEALKHRRNAKELRRQVRALAKAPTEPPPSDVRMVAE